MIIALRIEVLLILFLQIGTGLQGEDIRFKHITVDDGLSQNTINCIFQDSKGFVWIGTQQGLNKYNAYSYKIFRYEPDNPYSLSHNWIWDIFEDSRHNLWISTWNGLSYYSPETGIFVNYFPDSTDQNSISGSRPTSVCEDKNGYIWIGTWGGGLNRFDPENSKFRHFPGDEKKNPGVFIRTIFIDKDDNLWVGTWDGLYRTSLNDSIEYSFEKYSTISTKNRLSFDKITAICSDRSGKIWIGTLGGGVNIFDPDKNKIDFFINEALNPNSLSSNDVTTILPDSRGNIWVGTVSSGLNLFNPVDFSFKRYLFSEEKSHGLNSNSIYSSFEDRSGMLWFGGSKGINLFNLRLTRFCQFNTLEKDRITEIFDINCFFEDNRNNLWIGTQMKGVIKYNKHGSVYNKDNISLKLEKYFQNIDISSLESDKNNNIWISTRGKGLYLFKNKEQKIIHLSDAKVNIDLSKFNYINGLYSDANNNLWIASYDQGLIKFDHKNDQIKHFKHNSGNSSGLPGNYLLRLYGDSKGKIWICTWGQGLSCFDPEKETFFNYRSDESDSASLPGNIIHAVYEQFTDTSRIMWIGTDNGLCYMNPDDDEIVFRPVYDIEGYLSQAVYSILSDDSSALWISTGKGVVYYNIQKKKIRIYNKEDGLQSNEFTAGAAIKLLNGNLLFGGVSGFNMFHPDSIKNNTFQPNIVFSGFQVFHEDYFLDRDLNAMKNIELNFKQNFFEIEFASLDYYQPEKNQYRYILEGVDKDWVYAGNRRFAGYTNISPGEYTFRVNGTNSDGIWSEKEAMIHISIIPPYWQTWWFRSIILIFLAAFLYGLYRYQIERVKEIERLRVRIASDLHDEIGSALTRITIHSQKLATEEKLQNIVSPAQKIGEISRNVISTMSDVIWSIDARNDSMRDMIDRMHDHAHSILAMKDIRVRFEESGLEKNRKIPVLFRQNVFFIFKESVNNIVKHSEATEVEIALSVTDTKFFMQISDNGKGFNKIEIKQGNGLKNMQMRAERIRAFLALETDNGTRIILTVPKIFGLK